MQKLFTFKRGGKSFVVYRGSDRRIVIRKQSLLGLVTPFPKVAAKIYPADSVAIGIESNSAFLVLVYYRWQDSLSVVDSLTVPLDESLWPVE